METALLNNATPIHVRLTSMLDQGLSFNLRLTDFSAGGIAGLADREVVQQLATGPFWAEFELPGGHELLECVVRLVYRRAGPSTTARPSVGPTVAVMTGPGSAINWRVSSVLSQSRRKPPGSLPRLVSAPGG